MFDLDLIEQDWKNNSFSLSEEEIIEIYRSDGATWSKYDEEWAKYKKKINSCIPDLSPEERLLRSIFKEDLKEQEQRNKLIAETPKPQKKHLSKANQKKVVEGSLHMVFNETRWWYNFFEGKLSMERIYYICLEALMNSVKYLIHVEKPIFRFYVSKSIERNMIKHIAKYIYITYREAYEIIHYISDYEIIRYISSYDSNNSSKDFAKYLQLLFDYERKEEPEKPSKIFYRLKDEHFDFDYIKNISSNEFIKDYKIALENLDDIAKIVMQLSFDKDGNHGLTNNEIADYLGMDSKKIYNIRKRAMNKLKKDVKLKSYL